MKIIRRAKKETYQALNPGDYFEFKALPGSVFLKICDLRYFVPKEGKITEVGDSNILVKIVKVETVVIPERETLFRGIPIGTFFTVKVEEYDDVYLKTKLYEAVSISTGENYSFNLDIEIEIFEGELIEKSM